MRADTRVPRRGRDWESSRLRPLWPRSGARRASAERGSGAAAERAGSQVGRRGRHQPRAARSAEDDARGTVCTPRTITFFQELRVDHQDEEAAERGPCECPERLQELHRGVPTRPTPPKSRSEGPGAASAPRRVQPPRPLARALHPPPTPRSAATGGATPGGDLCLFGQGGGERARGEGAREGAGGGGEVSGKSRAAAAAAPATRPPSRAAGRRGPERGGAAAAAP